MGIANRRLGNRIPLQMFLNEYVADRAYRSLSMNLSPSGILINRLVTPMTHRSPVIGLEFQLPGTSDTVWAKGEMRFNSLGQHFSGTGVEFTGIAQGHLRLIKEYCAAQRAKQLRKILATIKRNRMH